MNGLFALSLALIVTWWSFDPQTLELNAHTRAAGNRREDAVSLARTLLRQSAGPAQILHVRVDGAGGHEVAGVMLEGRSKHALSRSAFANQVATIVEASLEARGIEEVDVWAVVPIPVPKGAVVSGPMAVPVTKTVFAGTFRRSERAGAASKLREGRGIYVDPVWEATLVAEGPAPEAANPPG